MLKDLISRQSVLILDGGLGSEIERRGIRLESKLWSAWLLHGGHGNPQALFDIHYDFIASGADIVTTASYQASLTVMKEELGVSDEEAKRLIVSSVTIAARARDQWWEETSGGGGGGGISRIRPLIAFSMGSYGAYLADGSEFRGDYSESMSIEDLIKFHRSRLDLVLGNPKIDLLAFETIPCIKEAAAICLLLESLPSPPQAWISFSCKDGSTLNYNNESFCSAVTLVASSKARVAAVGVNCTNPDYIVPLLKEADLALTSIESLKESDRPILIVYPNSGEQWDSEAKQWQVGSSSVTPDAYAQQALKFVEAGAQIIGGCCRIYPQHIQALRSRLVG